MPNFSDLAKPFNTPFELTTAREGAFKELKDALIISLVLRAPRFKRPFELHTDLAKTSLGAVLSQRDNDLNEHVIGYANRCNDRAEIKYSAMRERL